MLSAVFARLHVVMNDR